MVDARLLENAARCYERANQPAEAARCYREIGAHRRSAELHMRMGNLREAAFDYAHSNQVHLAAWLLVHDCADPVAARAVLAKDAVAATGAGPARPADLRRLAVTARCALAERAPEAEVIAFLGEICADFRVFRPNHDGVVETWCVEIAEVMRRDDQAQLIFAAAVSGRRRGARERWLAWGEKKFGMTLVLPDEERTRNG
ncbi:hypothetical protein AB0C38_13605 [Amycolatopsis sp. NPDC048633]|uniref:hypothetical protein n=1 Tax=Amycolatopsis sp. NPDC048633 TaxID=3157095 RepID=UPI0033D07C04